MPVPRHEEDDLKITCFHRGCSHPLVVFGASKGRVCRSSRYSTVGVCHNIWLESHSLFRERIVGRIASDRREFCKLTVYSQDTVTWESRVQHMLYNGFHSSSSCPRPIRRYLINTEIEQMDNTSKKNLYLKQPHQLTNRVPGKSKRKRDEMVGERSDESEMEQEHTRQKTR
jgi:hypothetical protein